VLSQWKNDPFWNQPELSKEWNLDQLTAQDEERVGEQLNRLILELNPEDRGSGLRRVIEVAQPLLEQVRRADRAYRFFVLASEVPNAFSHTGGYVYVSRRLLELIPEDEEHLLEFVIGHEMAHVELRHGLACLRDPRVRKFSDGTLQKLYFLIIPYGYPDPLEFAADEWVYRRMKQLGRSDHDCFKFLRILDRYAEANGFQQGRGKPEELLKENRDDPEGRRAISPIDNHLRSHPAADERLRHLKKLSGTASHSPR
jgi:Zn-dependent protease with chaperone function